MRGRLVNLKLRRWAAEADELLVAETGTVERVVLVDGDTVTTLKPVVDYLDVAWCEPVLDQCQELRALNGRVYQGSSVGAIRQSTSILPLWRSPL